MPSSRKIEVAFFFLLSAGAAFFAFLVLKPYLGALFVALVLSIAFQPAHAAFVRAGMRQGLAAALTLLFLCIAVLAPFFLFGFFVFDDARKLYEQVSSGAPLLERLDAAAEPLERRLQSFAPGAELNLSRHLRDGLSFLVGNFGSVFTGAVGVLFKTLIMFLALFYLFRDGGELRTAAMRLSPLANEYDEQILTRLEEAISSVVKGKLLIVCIQGALAAAVFVLLGLPHSVLLGAAVALSALIPAVGVAIVFVPVVLYLFFTAGVLPAVGLLVVGVGVGVVDNVLGPLLYKRGLRLHPLLILLSVLGGLAFFGPVGFLAGPVTLSLFFALLDIYPLLFQSGQS